jgi:ribonuclease HI
VGVLITVCTNTSFTLVLAIEAAKSTSLLVQQCQKALNDISTRHSVALSWFPGRSGVRGDEIADGLAREGTVHCLLNLNRQYTKIK